MKKYYIPVGVLAIAILAATLSLNPGGSAVAQAQEQVARAFTRAIAISPEMREQLEAQMKADMLETLEEAKAAPDLKIMTKEEFQKESPFSFSHRPGMMALSSHPPQWEGEIPEGGAGEVRTIAFSHEGTPGERVEADNVMFTARADGPIPQGGSVMSAGAMVAGGPGKTFSEPVKYLSYTDPRGNKTVLGLDKDDTPVFKFSTINSADLVHMDDGTIGIEGKAIKMIRLEDTEIVE